MASPDQIESDGPKTLIITNPQANQALRSWQIRAWFVSGRSLNGEIVLPYDEFYLDQVVARQRFYQKTRLDDVKSIRVRHWKPEILSRGERTEYHFLPDVYRVILKTGQEFQLDSRLKMLDTLELKTRLGLTRIYTYFVDYWLGDEFRGEWENTGKKVFSENQITPLPETVYRIDFLED